MAMSDGEDSSSFPSRRVVGMNCTSSRLVIVFIAQYHAADHSVGLHLIFMEPPTTKEQEEE